MATLQRSTHPLLLLVQQGEGKHLDFKQTVSSARKIAKSLVAFANTGGGQVLIGIKDNGSIVGASTEEEAYMIESASNFYCDPIVPYHLIEHNYMGKMVLEVLIPESRTKPHFALCEDNKWWAYVRVNDKCVLASKVQLDVFRRDAFQDPTLIEFTSKEKALLEYLQQHERITLKQYCKMLNISRRIGSRILVDLIRAGVLFVHTTEKEEFYTMA
jgi:predicted HTH transcriptional regulator